MIETARLNLRAYIDSDIPELVSLIGAPEVAATTVRIPHPYTEAHARQFLASESDDLRLAIVLKDNGHLCGGIGLHPNEQNSHAELGYWIGVPYWANGYATEAAQAVVRYGFENMQLQRIFAMHFKENVASGNVLRRIGMKHEGCMRQHILKWGKFIDIELFGILRQELPPEVK